MANNRLLALANRADVTGENLETGELEIDTIIRFVMS